ncbi:unnamed protein product [Strongylus vulgaris]|uniref:G-protein coupled receptors family 1 profile domain-containing protein n=1 Tax=Strongylus vulgaris TaxID=40348 RepID=A0A3P7M390_STRVU|nr:unnamed protein product [Strongylus vulgaris]
MAFSWPNRAKVISTSALECFRDAHPEQPLVRDRIWLGFSLTLATLISFILNAMLLIITTKANILERQFRYHVISLILASIVYLVANILILIPTTVGSLYIADPWNAILSSTDNLGYLALMFSNTIVAADRFTFFFLREVRAYILVLGCATIMRTF